jgi:hypothetical protein
MLAFSKCLKLWTTSSFTDELSLSCYGCAGHNALHTLFLNEHSCSLHLLLDHTTGNFQTDWTSQFWWCDILIWCTLCMKTSQNLLTSVKQTFVFPGIFAFFSPNAFQIRLQIILRIWASYDEFDKIHWRFICIKFRSAVSKKHFNIRTQCGRINFSLENMQQTNMSWKIFNTVCAAK